MTESAPECAALAEGLRNMRARTGLSMAALAECTDYSKSSWERYLNGKKPAPWPAVNALCALAREPNGRLRALWELADAEWSGRARHTSSTASPVPAVADTGDTSDASDTGGMDGHRRARLQRFALGTGAVGLVAAAVLAAFSLQGSGAGEPVGLPSPTLDPLPGCRAETCEGKHPADMSCALPGRVRFLGPKHPTRTGAFVWIRYSQVCAAAWGRFQHTRVGDRIEISAPGSQPQQVEVTDSNETMAYLFTNMIDASDLTGLEVCFYPVGVGMRRECFSP